MKKLCAILTLVCLVGCSTWQLCASCFTGTYGDQFGMGLNFNTNGVTVGQAIPFNSFRFWDTTISGQNTKWNGLCPSNPGATVALVVANCNWTSLTTWLGILKTLHVDSIIYPVASVPAWASSNPSGTCNGNTAGTCYAPANLSDLTNFTQGVLQEINTWSVANSYTFAEINVECWNEPNANNFWNQSLASLVPVCQTVYNAVKAVSSDKVLCPPMQGHTGYSSLDTYLAAGGGAYCDVIGFHAYDGTSVNSGPPITAAPEVLATLVSNYLTTMSNNGVSAKPLWNTEYSWDSGDVTKICDADEQSRWVGRAIPLLMGAGVVRNYWYQADNQTAGTLYTLHNGQGCNLTTPPSVTKAGTAWSNVRTWIRGHTIAACQTNSSLAASCTAPTNTWTCTLTGPGSYSGYIIWTTASVVQSCQSTVAGHVKFLLDGWNGVPASPQAVSIGTSFNISSKPDAVENQ